MAGMVEPSLAAGLPVAALNAANYGLKQSVVHVHTASEPKQFAVTGYAPTPGARQARSGQSAAESYAEDLFQRGHVDVGKHGSESAVRHPWSFKSHKIVETEGQLLLKRVTFDCGMHSSIRPLR